MCEEKKVTYANQVQIHALKCIMQLGLPFQACNSSPKSLSFFFIIIIFLYSVVVDDPCNIFCFTYVQEFVYTASAPSN